MDRVTSVEPTDDYSLMLTFQTGEHRLFDMRPYLERGVFQTLKDPQKFKQAFAADDTVCWPGNLDISPATLYDRSIPVPPR